MQLCQFDWDLCHWILIACTFHVYQLLLFPFSTYILFSTGRDHRMSLTFIETRKTAKSNLCEAQLEINFCRPQHSIPHLWFPLFFLVEMFSFTTQVPGLRFDLEITSWEETMRTKTIGKWNFGKERFIRAKWNVLRTDNRNIRNQVREFSNRSDRRRDWWKTQRVVS